MITRKQHYVWRYYLAGWQQEDELVLCLRDGKKFATNPVNIMAERDFYRLSELTKSDVMFFEAWLARQNRAMRTVHRSLLIALGRIANGNALIQGSKSASAKDKALVRSLVIEMEEKLQAEIEERALPLVEELRRKRIGFLDEDQRAMTFFQFIAHQYFRTKSIREAITSASRLEDPRQDFGRLGNILCYCAAENVGCSLYVDRGNTDVVFLANDTELGFITGDQPIVNLITSDDESPPDDLVLYYPISPNLAVLIAPKKYRFHSMKVCRQIVQQLNEFIAWKSRHFLVSYSSRDLQTFERKSNSQARPTCHLISGGNGTVVDLENCASQR